MNKNEEYKIEITSVTAEGNGVGHIDGIAVFVPLTAVGDIAEVKIVKVKKSYAYGKLLNIVTPSKNRIVPDCEVFNKCGGCVYRHISYEAEKAIKQQKVASAINRIGGIPLEPQPILSNNTVDGYRNKAQYPVSTDGLVGFYAVHSHRVVPCENCLLQPEEFESIAKALTTFIKEKNISVYNEETAKGLLRHLYIRKALATGQIMVSLVINGKSLPFADEFVNLLKHILGEALKTVVLNHNTKNTNVILGDKNTILYGDGYITDILCGVKIRISPLSFYQVNRDMAEILYNKAALYAQPDNKTVLDLYCGAGTIGLSMASRAKKIIGVEIIPEAVEDAKFNAQNNGISNADFICGDAAYAAAQLASKKITADVVLVDPPRKGCEKALLETIANDFKPERIVYVSCDCATLARDCAILQTLGYTLKEYTPVDLFPRTAHVETVALLTKD